ncbi:GatB/YqeY domain-containing protein [Candidatus Gottesmanbacteria bacterium]|nr:GatB/YqeY domain-containing protein [Candidatus Gottesmanbacteria bacterium]
MLIDELRVQLRDAMKSGDTERRDTIRFLLSAVNNGAIAKYGNEADKKLTDSDVLDAIKKLVKTHRESIEAFEKADRRELADKEKKELAILEQFLPAQMSDDELKKLLLPVVASGETNFGLLMKQSMMLVAGKADGGRVSALLRQMISSKQ